MYLVGNGIYADNSKLEERLLEKRLEETHLYRIQIRELVD